MEALSAKRSELGNSGQHTKFWRRCRGVILVDFFFSFCEPYFVLEIFQQKKKKIVSFR